MAVAPNYYQDLATYFSARGGTGSPGKSGGAGYSNDSIAGAAAAYYGGYGSGTPGTASGSNSVSGAGTQTDSPTQTQSSGSGFVSAAVGTTSTDKSFFSTPFEQSFGGIANYQIIDSPNSQGASGAASAGGSATGSPDPAYPLSATQPIISSAGITGSNNGLYLLIALATLAVAIFKR